MAAAELRRVADDIDSSRRPSAGMVSEDLRRILAAVEGRTAWSLFKSKGEKKIQAKIKELNRLIKASSTLAKMIRSGEDFSTVAKNEEYVKAMAGACEFIGDVAGATHASGGSEIIDAMSNIESEGEMAEALGEMDGLYQEDDSFEEEDRKAMVAALGKFAQKAKSRIEDLGRKAVRQRAEQKKGGKLEGEPGRGGFFQRMKGGRPSP